MTANINPDSGRREFLAATTAGMASLALSGIAPAAAVTSTAAADTLPWARASVAELQALMSGGALSAVALAAYYLGRIAELNSTLGAVIETDPAAADVAARLDRERRSGQLRGPLHGIPVLLKDNVATAGAMSTTAGSLALLDTRVAGDAPLVSRLRRVGALILGKANLSEWSNFRGLAPFNGWSARGGFTRNPYVLDADPGGSSSGSAVAVAADLCAVAVGTDTAGSIVWPASQNGVVALRPTVGLISRRGIIPISRSQDTAGPIGRSVADVATLLNALTTPFGSVSPRAVATDYRAFLDAGALAGARIGIDLKYLTPAYAGSDLPDRLANTAAIVDKVVAIMQAQGASVVDTSLGDDFAYLEAQLRVVTHEYRIDLEAYLRTLRPRQTGAGQPPPVPRTIADLIDFNLRHCDTEMKHFGQEWLDFVATLDGNPGDPEYLAARAFCVERARLEGVDRALRDGRLDAVMAPTFTYVALPAAVAGYPVITFPAGEYLGVPVGMSLLGGFLQEPRLLALAYAFEQAAGFRPLPRLLGRVPDQPPDAGICSAFAPGAALS